MATQNPVDDVEQLRAEIQILRDQLARLSTTQAESDRNFAKEIQDELRQTLDKARATGEQVLGKARAGGDKAIDEIEKQIEQRPLLVLLLVFLAGLFLSKLVERR